MTGKNRDLPEQQTSYVLLVFGTRPEFLKLIPVIRNFRENEDAPPLIILYTGQHKELVEPLFGIFSIFPDIYFESLRKESSLSDSVNSIYKKLIRFISESPENIFYILAQGDTTSCFCAAKAAAESNIPFAHIEAGLRSHRVDHPFPEEFFRRFISKVASMHFAPTSTAFNNLLNERTDPSCVILTGNTIVDTVHLISENTGLVNSKGNRSFQLKNSGNNILVTCHRRENQANLDLITSAVFKLADENPEFTFIWAEHPAPAIQRKLGQLFTHAPSNVFRHAPLTVLELYALYPSLKIIITDSGGIQEEAVSFGVPVIVIREVTERMESVEAGYSIVAGLINEKINEAFYHYLNHTVRFNENPYGDGKASLRIVEIMSQLYNDKLNENLQYKKQPA